MPFDVPSSSPNASAPTTNANEPLSTSSPPETPAAATTEPTDRSMPGRRDHEGHPDGQHADDRGLDEDGPEVVDGREGVGLEHGADDHQQRHDDPGQGVLLEPSPRRQLQPPDPCRPLPWRTSLVVDIRTLLGPCSIAASGPGSTPATISWVPGIAWRSTSSSVAVAPSSSATSSPSRITRIRVQRPQSSSISDDTTTTPSPWPARSAMMRNSSAFVSTSTPRVGSSSSRTRHRRRSQRARTTFCWFPPDSSRAIRLPSDGVVRRCRSCSSAAARSARTRSSGRWKRRRSGEGHVLGQAPLQQQGLGLAVLGGEPEPGRDRQIRTMRRQGRPSTTHLAGIPGVDAVDRPQQLAAAGPDESGDPEHLAGAQLEAGLLHVGQATHAPDLEHDVAAAGRSLGEQLLELAADHERHEIARGCRRGQAGRDRRPLAQHRHPVADPSDLVEPMRDVHHPDALIREAPHDVEQGVDLVVVEDGRGLVHDEEADVAGERPCDRHDLLARGPQAA